MIYFANPATSHGRNHGKVRRSKTGLVGSWEAATFDVTDETYAYSVRTRTFGGSLVRRFFCASDRARALVWLASA